MGRTLTHRKSSGCVVCPGASHSVCSHGVKPLPKAKGYPPSLVTLCHHLLSSTEDSVLAFCSSKDEDTQCGPGLGPRATPPHTLSLCQPSPRLHPDTRQAHSAGPLPGLLPLLGAAPSSSSQASCTHLAVSPPPGSPPCLLPKPRPPLHPPLE